MAEYGAYSDRLGKLVRVPELDEALESIRIRVQHDETRIKVLEDENQKLKDEAFKDTKLKEMQNRLKIMEDNYYRGFPISEDEEKAISEWKNKHDAEVHNLTTPELRMKASGVSGGRYSYHFIPTSIGVSGTVECSCGAKFEFQHLG
jgi:hypothetical protein